MTDPRELLSRVTAQSPHPPSLIVGSFEGASPVYDRAQIGERALRYLATAPVPVRATPQNDTSTEGVARSAGAVYEHREGICGACGREYAVWFAPSDIWNMAMRDAEGREDYPFICPSCFIEIAEATGLRTTGWLVCPDIGQLDGPIRRASDVLLATDSEDAERPTPQGSVVPSVPTDDRLRDAHDIYYAALVEIGKAAMTGWPGQVARKALHDAQERVGTL